MRRFLASETLTVLVLVVLFAGDFWRNLITVPGWVAISLACAAWAVASLVLNRVSFRVIPLSLVLTLGWIALSPLWSPYAGSAALLTLGFILTVVTAIALATTIPGDALVDRTVIALRSILVASLVFEVAVALTGKPLYPVGFDAPPGTSIELAWSRGLLFEFGERIQGIVGNANLLGMLALLLAIVQVVSLSSGRGRRGAPIDVGLAVVTLWLTASTTVTLAGVAVVGVWALAWLARRPRLVSRIGFGTVLIGAIGLIAFALTNWSVVAAALGKSPDMTNRFGIWQAVLDRINSSPVVGSGFVGWWPSWEPWFALHSIRDIPVQQAHNAWLDLMMQVGGVGTALFVVALTITGWRLWRQAVRGSDPAVLVSIGLFTALLVQTLTESRMLSEWGIALVVVMAITARRRDYTAPAPN